VANLFIGKQKFERGLKFHRLGTLRALTEVQQKFGASLLWDKAFSLAEVHGVLGPRKKKVEGMPRCPIW